MAQSTIRILLAEDNEDDQMLELRELKRAGLRVDYRLAMTPEDFVRELREFSPDVVISDFSMPKFDGMEALRLTREFSLDIPFIFVSGTLGEEYAVRALKNGATDYVLKSNLIRFPATVERAIQGYEERRARRHAEAGLRRAQSMARLGHIITGEGGTFESWSDSLPVLIGISSSDMPRSTRAWLELLHPADRDLFRRTSLDALASGKRVDLDYRLRHGHGAWIYIRQAIEPLDSPRDGKAGRWFCTLQDVTELKETSEAVRRLNRVYAVLSGINTLIVRSTDLDQLFRDACLIARDHGRFPLAWIGLVDAAGSRIEVAASSGGFDDYLPLMPLALGEGAPGTIAEVARDGVLRCVNEVESDPRLLIRKEALARGFRSFAILPLVIDGKVIGVMALYAEQAAFFDEAELKLLNELAGDISFAVDHIRKGKRLEYVANYDPLTGLANRTLLMDRLGQFFTAAQQEGRLCALCVVDVERFKLVNDSLGRPAGDALLGRLAERLVDIVGGDVTRIARVGPDHFAVIIPGVRAIERVAHAIDEGFERIEGRPFEVAGSQLRIAIRSGIAVFPNDGRDAEAVFRNAEAALKKARQQGDKYLFYAQEMTERVAERLSLETKLRQAVDREEFVLHYQPKVSLEDRRIEGLEALIRWQSPEGLVPPLKFIGVLEETGLIGRVGAWAVGRAARDRRAWLEAGLAAPRVAVNVSAAQLRQANFVAAVEQALQGDSGIDLEITESLLMDEIDKTIEKLKAVRALGVDIAIDDFGTGYSSLAYLSRLPVQALKIDRSFVISMDKDPNALTLVSTIISLAHSLKLKVVAEGVETEAQADTLRRLQCDQMQGYLVSKPVPADALAQLLR